jgi:hypothetical protein
MRAVSVQIGDLHAGIWILTTPPSQTLNSRTFASTRCTGSRGVDFSSSARISICLSSINVEFDGKVLSVI